jgi:SHS2 domain-containing protein
MKLAPGSKFRYLKHTADAKFQAFGDTLELAFANAASALVSLMWNPAEVSAAIRHPVRVSGKDEQQLLLAYLEEVLFLFESRGFLLHAAEGVRIEHTAKGYELQAVFVGDARRAGIEIYGDVKAVTYNDMKVRSRGRPMVQVVVDM